MSNQGVKEKTAFYEARSLSPILAAEIIGADLSKPVPPEMFKQLQADFERYHVLAFRDQNLSKDDLVRFTNLWGSVGSHVQRGGVVHTLSNADANGKPTGSHPETGALHFHADKSYMETVALATFLYGIEVPPAGGDTVFANMYMAYDALPADVKEKCEHLILLHSLEWQNRLSNNKLGREQFDRAPPVRHRLIWRHPQTGRKSIYVGSNAWKVEGWDLEQSRELIDYLNDFATQPKFAYAHKWKPRDLVMWDNRCTLHAGTPYDAGKYLRILDRTVVEVSSAQW
jgi:alpha-ketoglutarate-dependent taurine dioxygenase